jgi:hypothetical protein
MKIRQGFVSNSSSSSFIIAYKGVFDSEKLKAIILEKLKVPQDSPLYFIAKGISEHFSTADGKEVDEWEDDTVRDLRKKGFKIKSFRASSDANSEDGIEEMLYNNDLLGEFYTPELIEKEADLFIKMKMVILLILRIFHLDRLIVIIRLIWCFKTQQ